MTSAAAVTSGPCFLDHHCLLMTVQEQCQDEGDEEEYDVHYAEGPRRFQHGTAFVDVEMLAVIIPEDSQIDVD